MDSRGISEVKFPMKIQQWLLLLMGIRSCWQDQPYLWLCWQEKFSGTYLLSMLGWCRVSWSKAWSSPATANLAEVSLAGGYFPLPLLEPHSSTVWHSQTGLLGCHLLGQVSPGAGTKNIWKWQQRILTCGCAAMFSCTVCFTVFSGLGRGELPPFVTLAYT